MIHLGDITKIKGNEAPTVDCIVGGSPCQDLSLAGKRAGLAGARSGLYMEQIRIIKEMRENDRNNGRTGVDIRPRYMVWENVPGAFSTNKGQDFAAVLEEAIRVAEPEAPNVDVPEKGWPTSGCFYDEMGKWSVAWRVLDAQFWGTSDKPLPQRRRRIALVADFGGLSASEILFVRKSLSGDIEPGEQKRKEAPRDARESSGGTVPYTLKIRSGVEVDSGGRAAGKGALIQTDKTGTLSTVQDQYLFQPVFGIDQQGGKGGANFSMDVAPPMMSDSHGTPHAVCYTVDQGGGKSSVSTYEGVSPTLTRTNDGAPAVVYGISPYHSNCMKSDNPHSGYYEAETSRSLDAMNCGYPGCNQGGMAVVQPVTVCIEGNGSRPSHKGDGYIESGTMYTLNTTEHHAVAYGVTTKGNGDAFISEERHTSLTSGGGQAGQGYPCAMTPVTFEPGIAKREGGHIYEGVSGTIRAHAGDNQMAVAYSIENHPADSRVDIDESGKVQTLTSRMGTGGGNVPMVMESVPYAAQSYHEIKESSVGASLKASGGVLGGGSENFVVAGVDCRNATEYLEMNGTLQSDAHHNHNSNNVVRVKHIVRRLTPLECERLQGFPDGWTDIGEWVDSKGKKHKEADSPRYKALGNSIALPPWKWVLKRLCACYERDATMASLFDGIGGFPLIWEQLNGKGSCLWASEIEEFPMAVTKVRFG